jgi:hypothetical protein
MPVSSLARVACALATLAALGGCAASAPVIYAKEPNTAQQQRVQRDIEQCTRRAETQVGRQAGAQHAAKGAAKAGAIGFVGAAAAGAAARSSGVWERARGAAAGGVAGITTKLLLEWNEGDKVFQEYVERCLEERGHDVLGWR